MHGEVFLQLRGIGSARARALAEAGFESLEDIQRASLDQLAQVPGIGTRRARELRQQAADLLGEGTETSAEPPGEKPAPVVSDPRSGVFSPSWAAVLVVGLVVAGGAGGALLTYWSIADDLDSLEQRNHALQQQLDGLQFPSHNITYFLGNTSLAALYEQVRPSIVVIHGYTVQQSIFGQQYGESQGSGFIYNQSGEHVVVTNYHVVRNTVNITVTLCNGRAFAAEVLGSDPYADLAVLEVNAERAELPPLAMTSSATLRVGDPVVAIGTPFGLAGTMTTGIVSHLGRTIRESTAGDFSIANIIQISTPINPGNSGGPLLNYQGEVVGITTAIVSESQGLGFAIPSATVLRELPSLVSTGSYTRHSWLGVTGYDMDYHLARVMGVNVTYGWLLAGIQDGGPADKAGLQGGNHQVSIGGTRYVVGGDVVVAIDNRSVLNGDDLMSYLAAHTLPGQTIQVTVVRHNETVTLPVTLGTRPPPPG